PRDHDHINAVAYSPDGKYLVSALWREVRVWDPAAGRVHATLRGHAAFINGLAFSGQGTRLASAGGHDRTVRVWDVETGEDLLDLRGHTGMVLAVAFSRDGRRIASVDYTSDKDGTVKVWDAAASLEARTFTASVHLLDTSLAFSPNGRL